MSTVASRTFRSTPYRDAAATWEAIIELLTQGKNNSARSELYAIKGIACSLISDQYPKSSPIITTCEGPRTRIYCIYDEDAIDGTGMNEDVLGFEPLKGDWKLSLPCAKIDLEWVQSALKKISNRITARDSEDGLVIDKEDVSKGQSLEMDLEAFLKS